MTGGRKTIEGVGEIENLAGATARLAATHGNPNLLGGFHAVVKGLWLGDRAYKATLVISEKYLAIFVGYGIYGLGVTPKPHRFDRVWPLREISAVRLAHHCIETLSEDLPLVVGRLVLDSDPFASIRVVHRSEGEFTFIAEDEMEVFMCGKHLALLIGHD